jgi:hypothetical protein
LAGGVTVGAVPSILGGCLKGLLIPFCPSPKQNRSVPNVEHRMSELEELEAVIGSRPPRATHLHESIFLALFKALYKRLMKPRKNTKPVVYAYGFDRLGFLDATELDEEEFVLRNVSYYSPDSLERADGLVILMLQLFRHLNRAVASPPQDTRCVHRQECADVRPGCAGDASGRCFFQRPQLPMIMAPRPECE